MKPRLIIIAAMFHYLMSAHPFANILHAQHRAEEISVSFSEALVPTFSWNPDMKIGRLVVTGITLKLWETETDGESALQSPIRYGEHPANATSKGHATPLIAGLTYRVILFRWTGTTPEKHEFAAATTFMPAHEARREPPVAAHATIEAGNNEHEPDELQPAASSITGGVADEDDEQIDSPSAQLLRVSTLDEHFPFNGSANGSEWRMAIDSIANLVMIEPEEGRSPSDRTIVKVFANKNEILVAARCYDSEPEGIVSYSKARDADLEEEDHIMFVLDTFQDGRSGYVFAVNPTGARFDGLIEKQGEDVNSNWDTFWEARTSQDDSGWCAQLRIPIKSLGFRKDSRAWGFNVQRRVQRLQETSRWSGAKRDYEVYQTSRAGQLVELPEFDFGAGLSVRPSIVGKAGRSSSSDPTSYNGDMSLDLTQKLGPNLLSALTLNTDFAETEVDVRQINVSRFPLFFPEKRSFFLEGADIFEFGVGLDEEKLVPFFSRRIGLLGIGGDDQAAIPINVGGKINGRVGETNLGALVVNTRAIDNVPAGETTIAVPKTTMGAIRIRQNVFEESSIGMLATYGDQSGRSGSWSAGIDLTLRTSSFLDDKNFIVGVWGLLNDRDELAGDKSAFGFKVDYPNDLFALNLSSIRIGDGYDPSLGFTPRNNLHIWEFSGEYKPRPSWEFVRQMFVDVTATLYNSRDNSRWESYDVSVKPLSVLFESGDRLETSIQRQGDRPPTDFEISSDVDLPAGSYQWTRYTVHARSAEKRALSGEFTWNAGDYYNGSLRTMELRLTFRPSALFAVEITGERSAGSVMALPDHDEDPVELARKEFTEELFGFRVQLNFSPELQFSSLTQYDTQSKELGSNNKLRWTFHPLGDIFIVYNHNLVRVDDRWQFVSNQMPVKLQYTWRF